MLKKPLLLFAAVMFSAAAFAQDFKYGDVTRGELDMKNYDKDTAAHAVVLNEFASARIAALGTRIVGLVYEYHTRIKFFDNKDFNEGTIKVRIYQNAGYSMLNSEIRKLKATTYFTDAHGLEQSAELDTTKVYQTRENNYWVTYKFAMPAMRAGCVIEYKFQIVAPGDYNIPTFPFQSGIPKIKSEYNVHIPAPFTYNAVLKGPLKLSKNEAKEERLCFVYNGISNPCSNLTYGMSDIPAFKEEEYATSSKNFLSAITFEIADVTFYFGKTVQVTSDWGAIDKTLKESFYFGEQLQKAKIIKKLLTGIAGHSNEPLEQAKAAYSWIQKNYKWNRVYGFDCQFGFEKLGEQHTGNTGDINLALAAILRSQGLQADPVLLSTRENGMLNTIHPTLLSFDYVIVKLHIGEKDYFLDATEPLLSFGLLPLRCLNGQGRVISQSGPSYWTDLNTLQKELKTYAFDLTMHEDGKINGTLVIYSAGYSGYKKRTEIKKYNTIDEYVEQVSANSPKLNITRSGITNVDSLDLPVVETYDAEIRNYIKGDNQHVRIDPFMAESYSVNPFRLPDRTYPVDFGMPSESRISITLHLPGSYKVVSYPQDIHYALPENGAKFATSFDIDGNTVNFSYILQFRQAIYLPDEYQMLKEFVNKIILEQKIPITLVKQS